MYLFKPARIIAIITVAMFVAANIGGVCCAQDKKVDVRILSYNIHHGEGVDKKLDLKRIAKLISDTKADVVALQEVDVKTNRTKKVDQANVLAELTGMKVAFGPNIEFGGGKYGNAILTKHRILSSKNVKLPNHNNDEQRGLLQANIQVEGLGKELVFLATHFDHRKDNTERIASAKFVNEKIKFDDGKFYFIAGDFNDVIGSDPLKILEAKWSRSNNAELPTVPVDKPSRQIDFVFGAKSQNAKCVFTRVLSEAIASDHRAVLTHYELAK